MSDWALFGGAGFIGLHLAQSILERNPDDRVFILDIQRPRTAAWPMPLQGFYHENRLHIQYCDVREKGDLGKIGRRFDVIVNLAAIHREPGHRPEEYFNTNVTGAENICDLASETDCREIIFTSSIAVYGVHDRTVDENSAVRPKTAYGRSKLQAEEISSAWARDTGGRLLIIRPGVVFGPRERGNVTRLVRETLKRGRAIRLQPDQPKAGIYIEELLNLIHWLRARAPGESQLVNAVSNESLSFNDFGRALQSIRQFTKEPLQVSAGFLKTMVFFTKPLALVLPSTSKVHPERLAKLTRANDVRANSLSAMGYPFAWTLEKALADWLAKGI